MNITLNGNLIVSMVGAVLHSIPYLAGFALIKRTTNWLNVGVIVVAVWVVSHGVNLATQYLLFGYEMFFVSVSGQNFWAAAIPNAIINLIATSFLIVGSYLIFVEPRNVKQ